MSEDLWESHATWWQREFTNGVDPEYKEQILPLIADLTPGFKTRATSQIAVLISVMCSKTRHATAASKVSFWKGSSDAEAWA